MCVIRNANKVVSGMAGSYTQILIHAVFSVKHREGMLDRQWRSDVFRYTNGIVENHKCKVIALNGVEDHVHLFAGLHPSISVSDLNSAVKSNSSRFINEHFSPNKSFAWQDGYSAFSHSRSQISSVARYIENQEAHHKRKTFRMEYLEMMKKYDVEYDDRYVFEFFD